MFRNPFTKALFNNARKSFETKVMNPTSFTYKPQANFSRTNRFFSNLQRPLYQYLIGANLAVYLAWNSNLISKKFLYNHFTLSQDTIKSGHYHTLLTYSFSHIDSFHMFFNMFSLYFFGRFTEAAFGPKVLLHLYLGGALLSALMIHLSNKQYNNFIPTVGASGATAAILSFFIFNFPNEKILLFFLPVPAWIVGLLIFGQSIMTYDSTTGISGSGHLGGLIAGLMYFLATRGKF
jgi:membrane associated rhomboid family serine protease